MGVIMEKVEGTHVEVKKGKTRKLEVLSFLRKEGEYEYYEIVKYTSEDVEDDKCKITFEKDVVNGFLIWSNQ